VVYPEPTERSMKVAGALGGESVGQVPRGWTKPGLCMLPDPPRPSGRGESGLSWYRKRGILIFF